MLMAWVIVLVSRIHTYLQSHHVAYVKYVQLLRYVNHTSVNCLKKKAKVRARCVGKAFFSFGICLKNVFFI